MNAADHEPTGEVTLARRGVAALELLHSLPGDGPVQLDPEQRQVLAGWTGWGPLAKALDYNAPPPWGGLRADGLNARLRKIIGYRELETAKNACDTAFYTPPTVARAIWDIATGLGFGGGQVLEPGCGSGRFITWTPPGVDCQWTGVEADKASAAIATLLHPDATIIEGRLEKTPLRYGGFDLAVGNVPFSAQGVYDPNQPKGITSLHGYFLWRALSAVRPGGLAVFVTSRWILDAVNGTERDELAKLAAFAGAVRLPDSALAPGGTRAVTDIVVFRRRYSTEQDVDAAWRDVPDQPGMMLTTVSKYFQACPDMVCGAMSDRGGKKYGMTLAVTLPDGADLAAELDGRVQHLIADARTAGLGYDPRSGPDLGLPDGVDPALEGHYTLDGDGTVRVQRDGKTIEVQAQPELVALITLGGLAEQLFAAEADEQMGNNERNRLRQSAMRAYQEYTAQYGWLSRGDLKEVPDPDGEPGETMLVRDYNPVRRMFRHDPVWPTLLAIEVWDDDEQAGRPALILSRHVGARPKRKAHTDDPGEALLLCLDETGQVDLDVIARILQTTPGEVPGRLGDLIWLDPADQCWVTADEYLSGNVRAKLQQAKDAGEGFERHVAALEAVQPEDLGPDEINVQLGAPWLPPQVIEQFVAHILQFSWDHDWNGRRITCRYEPLTATWEVRGSTNARKQPAATSTWGTTRVNAVNLVEDACNGTTPVVYDLIDKVQVRNREETTLAAQKIRDLHEAFATWVWEDPARADTLCRTYNDLYNNVKVRTFDGSFLTFPGMAAGWEPYPHQVDMVARNLFTPTTLCGHVVGAGKTWSAVASAMKLRQLGMIRKPCMVVPNHLLEQTCAETRRYFPAAKILMVTREDLTPDRRKYFAAKCAAMDWDLVVVTIQQFGTLGVHPDIQAAYYSTLLDELDVAQANPALEESRATMKMLARKRKRLIAKLDALADMRKDGGVTFDQAGIDWLVIDEAHWAKNLEFSARAEGFSTAGSKRADDLMMKLDWLRGKHPDGRAGMLMTGTPVSNSLSELWVLFKYCAPHLLADHGLQSFDAFAAQFIRYQTQTEVDPSGAGFRSHRRPRLFVNLPEVRGMLWQFADIRTRKDLNLDGPEVTVEQVVADPPPEMAEFIQGLVERADRIRQGGVHPKEDNMLKVCGEGRAAALWMSMVGIDQTGPGKIEACAANVARIYHETCGSVYDDPAGDSLFDPRPGGFQIIFCDKGTPDSWDYGVYDRVRDLLIEHGVPARKIAYIHQARNHGDRPALFQRCRTGDIAVLLGSTEKLGTGVNIQRRLLAIHHLDAPWRPADIEQRDGRGDRPGNGNRTLRVFRYATKGSFDAYMWQALERKARFIAQVLTGDWHVREAEVVDSTQVLSFGELKALATGQPLLLMLSEVNSEVARLRVSQAGHKRARARLAADQYQAQGRAWELNEQAQALRSIARLAAQNGDRRMLVPDLAEHAEGDDAAGRLAEVLASARQYRLKDTHLRWRGVPVEIQLEYPKKGAPMLWAVLKPSSTSPHGHGWRVTGHIWHPADGARSVLEQIDAKIDSAETLAAQRDEERRTIAERAAELGRHADVQWPHAAELAQALERRAELEAEIDRQVKDSRQPQPAGV